MKVRGYVDEIYAVPQPAGGRIPLGSSVVITGWAARDDQAQAVMAVNIDGRCFPVTVGLDRPDVRVLLGEHYGATGFQAVISSAVIGAGRKYVEVTADGWRLAEPHVLFLAEAGSLYGLRQLPILPNGRIDTAFIAGADNPEAAQPSRARETDTLVIRGWGFDRDRMRKYTAGFAFIDETVVHVAGATGFRPDVAEVYATPEMGGCGFRLHVPLRGIGAGHHTVQVALGDSATSPLVRVPQTITLNVA
ncbi:hypothetical protein WPS_29350 [Vulcanimicrobium alpinum]|uniref:Uncharacterized protein n=1 Tax=Vulcanimicrobium alpinum TaxID=3016050 RepID=A0AAN1XZ77_UNVUL|nr:hypothetical protein [Vulcanimicrobium alpinum]BDE07659.1 hypothetical protein WPS_29350 [Vulcanimicrobium alpinum]